MERNNVPMKIPENYLCPITRKMMRNPVTAADGYTYEREAIVRWLQSHNTSPMTNQRLLDDSLIPNDTLRGLIGFLNQQLTQIQHEVDLELAIKLKKEFWDAGLKKNESKLQKKERKIGMDTIILIGNPGAGKSTILNGLIGEVKFKSGFSIGKGLTTVLQEEIKNDCRYVDTPGLSDIKMRRRAAEEITAALRKGGSFRIFFVVTLEAGRVKPDDATTMRLVLEAASEIKNHYSIILNKASRKVVQVCADNSSAKELLALFNDGLSYPTANIFANPDDPNLHDEDDKLPTLNPDLLKFINTAAPVTIHSIKVTDIQADEFEKIKEELSEKIQLLENDRRLLEEKILEQDKNFAILAQEMEKQKEDAKNLRERMASQLEAEKQSRLELKEDFDKRKRQLEKMIEETKKTANSRAEELQNRIEFLEKEVKAVEEPSNEEWEDYDSSKPCMFYKWGKCRRGGEVNDCPYRHDKKDRICTHFMNGYCKQGLSCEFLHPGESRK